MSSKVSLILNSTSSVPRGYGFRLTSFIQGTELELSSPNVVKGGQLHFRTLYNNLLVCNPEDNEPHSIVPKL